MADLLDYPFDAKLLGRKRAVLRRELLKGTGFVEKRIAVLGGSTTHDLVALMELFLLKQGIRPLFWEGEYNQWWNDAVFGNAQLDAFKPDLVFIHTTVRNVKEWPTMEMDSRAIERLSRDAFSYWEQAWSGLRKTYQCPIIQNNFEFLPYRLLGNLDAVDERGRVHYVARLNAAFADAARTQDGLFINDLNWQAADFGLAKWHDEAYWCLYKYAMSKDAVPVVSFNVANIIKAVFGKSKKALALDLDNTLWGGVVGDDGVENLELGTETAIGQSYTEFQSYLKGLQERGVLLNVLSKNERENALAGLNHPQMVLKTRDFASIKADWEPKSENLRAMANELSLLPDAFVFVDDNPAERELVRQQVPDAAVPELGEVENYISVLDHGGYFESVKISGDDLKRNAMYRANAQRAELKASFSDYGAYLDSLQMQATIRPFESVYISRIAQLTNKSNQFNLTTRRYTQDEISAVAASNDFIARAGRLVDRFGDNGIVAVSIGEIKGDVLELVLWLMSCRVLKREMEFAMMDEMVAAARTRGVKTIRGFYFPTAKNALVKDFYATQGFVKVAESAQGETTWELSVAEGYELKNKHIQVNH